MIGTFARVIFGFVLACCAAGLVQVLFVMPPTELLQVTANDFPARAQQVGLLALLSATHAAIFAAAFALIAAGIGEWMRVRAAAYYVATGMVISALGFMAQYASEVAGQPTIFNGYAVMAFLTSGAVAGFIYWLAAGRGAGGRDEDEHTARDVVSDTTDVPTPARSWKNRPRILVEDKPVPGSGANKKASLAQRLAEQEAAAADAISDAQSVAQKTAAAAVVANGPKPTTKIELTEADKKSAVPAAAPSAKAPPEDTDRAAKKP